MKLIFMGSSTFALPTLRALYRAGYDIVAVFTQPDRPAGRGLKISESPIKTLAREMGLSIEQPETLWDQDIQRKIAAFSPEMIIVVSYGLKLPAGVLRIPKYGCLNLHPSLLPKYRGAAPINWAIINGETETGITVISMSSRMDAGDIVLQQVAAIGPEENAGELEVKLSVLGSEMMLEAVELVSQGRATPMPQDESLATLAPKIKPEDCRIDWSLNSKRIVNLIRGLTPRPGAYALFRGRRLGISQARIDLNCESSVPDPRPGSLVGMDMEQGPVVRTGDGAIILVRVKPEGKREMDGAEFLRGYRVKNGEVME